MVFSAEEYLKQEYSGLKKEPVFAVFGKQKLILPAFYALTYSKEEAQTAFLSDLRGNTDSGQRLSAQDIKNYRQAVKLTAKANKYAEEKIMVRVDDKQRRKLQKFIAGNRYRSDNKILNGIMRYKNRILYGSLIAAATISGGTALHLAKYEKAAIKVLLQEGGYANGDKIDQETKYGITNPTLKSFKENFAKDAKGFPETVKDLSFLQANKIIRVAFYEHYKINEIKNQSMSDMVFDAVFNHDYNTFRGFVKEGLIAVKKMRGEDIETRPRNWKDVPEFLNNCTNEEQKAFYDAMVQARIDFISKDGYIKKYKGLKKRIMRFAGKYRAEANPADNSFKESTVRFAIDYTAPKAPLTEPSRFNDDHQTGKLAKGNISWEQAMKAANQNRGLNG